MQDYLLSLIRTAVTTAIGVTLGWVSLHVVAIPADHRLAFTSATMGLVTLVYYAVVRAIEARAKIKGAPWLLRMAGVLLGGSAPTYRVPVLTSTDRGPER